MLSEAICSTLIETNCEGRDGALLRALPAVYTTVHVSHEGAVALMRRASVWHRRDVTAVASSPWADAPRTDVVY